MGFPLAASLHLKAFPRVLSVPDLRTESHLFSLRGPGSGGQFFTLPLQMHLFPLLRYSSGLCRDPHREAAVANEHRNPTRHK